MIDPLQSYPAALKEIIETFETQDLDAACFQALKLPPAQNKAFQKPLEENPLSLGIWLWSLYFDAHWMSDSMGEWSRIHHRLTQFLENDPSWVLYHESLLERLRATYMQAEQIHQYLLSNDPLSQKIPPAFFKRFTNVLPWLSKERKHSFRMPLHFLPKESITSNATLGFWEACQPLQKPVALGSLYLASDLLSLCYGADFIEAEASILPIETGIESQTKAFEILSKAFETSHPLSHYWKQAFSSCPNDRDQRLLLFSKYIQNESRKWRFNHYGALSRTSLLYRYQQSDWYEKLALRNVPIEEDTLKQQLTLLYQEGLKKSLPRVPSEKKLPRIIHITSQLVDQSHAPTKILHRLMAMGDRDRLDQAVIVTESLIERFGDYPSHLRHAGSSESRAPHFIRFLEKEKFAYLLERPNTPPYLFESLDALADRLAARLNPIDADAIVFHGPEPLHHALASRLKGPLKILFEHGTLPKAPGFDVAICCLEDTLNQASTLESIGTRLRILPFAADSRWSWKPEMPKKEDVGIADTYRIATTISNHLKTRLQPKFCKAVSLILQRIPDLYYVPIGNVDSAEEMLERFDEPIRSRIRFLGAQQDPSQFTRCMDLYLNEFPFGSCYGILDAMASGCPVVSMYDPKGPPQARYGGLFMGVEESTQSEKLEAYVEKACFWLQNPLEYFKASQKSFQNYEWRSNYWAYVYQFENILIEEIAQHQKQQKNS